MSIALILTVCTPLTIGESCNEYVVDSFPTLTNCITAMADNRQVLDDRYLSCAPSSSQPAKQSSTKAAIEALNSKVPYTGGSN